MKTFLLVISPLLVSYVQIFIVNKIFPKNFAPDFFVVAVIFISKGISAAVGYPVILFLGFFASILKNFPAGFEASAFLFLSLALRISANYFDAGGFVGRFLLGFFSSLFLWLIQMFMALFFPVWISSFGQVLWSGILTGIFTALLWNFFKFQKDRRVV